MPVLTVIAGPNGSGKTSVVGQLHYEGRENLLDPDAIARRINPEDLHRAAVSAGREVIRRTREYLENSISFAIETTLSSGSILDTMKRAHDRGFAIYLSYVCLDSAERNIQRVRERVAGSGHDVPEIDVRRRYERSLSNLPSALNLADHARIYDNSGQLPVKVLEMQNGDIIWRAPELPRWLTQALSA